MKVLITGTARGIGRACALKYLAEGHEVFGFDIRESTILADRYTHLIADITKELPDISGVQVLVNNAGIQLDGELGGGSDTDLLVDIAQAGDDEGHRQGRDLQGEASVNIRRRTLAGTFHHDTRADDRLLRLCIGDDALQAGRCRPSRFTEPQTGKQHQAAAKKISPQRFDVCRF